MTPSVLLLGTPEVDELIKSHKPGRRPALYRRPPHIQEMLKLLIASGQLRHKLEAARIVLDLAGGVSATAQSVGAALGAAAEGALSDAAANRRPWLKIVP